MTARATDAAGTYDTGYDVVEYPHTQRRHVPKPATARIKVIDVTVAPNTRVGYIMGVGDQVPQALSQLGARVDLITPEQLASARPVAVQRDRHRRAGVRAPSGSAGQQQAADRVRLGRRHGAGAVQQVRVQRGAVRAVSGQGVVRPRDRRERADRGAPAVRSGVLDAEQARARDLDGLGAGARALLPRRARSALRRSPVHHGSRSSSTRASRPARWSKRVSARAAGCTLALGSGGSCQQGPSGRTA